MGRRGYHLTRSRAAAALILAVCLLMSGCGLVTGPQPLSEDAPLSMQVNSPVVSAKGILPAAYTCYGAGESPPVSWSGAPARTRSFALVIDDHDAPIAPYLYWLVVNISDLTTEIQAGHRPPGAWYADNSTGHARYDAPCPSGSTHQYRITVYALNTRIAKAAQGGQQLLPTWTAIAPHVLARGTMNVTACPPKGNAGWIPVCAQVKTTSST
jgi:Raf kinase inhibitor-like YbhB/YbcL family protein